MLDLLNFQIHINDKNNLKKKKKNLNFKFQDYLQKGVNLSILYNLFVYNISNLCANKYRNTLIKSICG